MNAWQVLATQPARLHDALQRLATDSASYYGHRAAFASSTNNFERAVLFTYLNRYCFNGIYRTNRANVFNVPYGTSTGSLPPLRSFTRCSEAIRTASFSSCDFASAVDVAESGDVVYFDPPYPTGRPTYGEYGYGSFSTHDLRRLQRCIEKLNQRHVVTVISVPVSMINSFAKLSDVDIVTTPYSVASHAHHRRLQQEVVLVSGFARQTVATHLHSLT
jgi:DNA adenine methylase